MVTARAMTVLAIAAAPLSAQRAPANVPIRPLGVVVSTSAITFQQIQHLRALSNGKVLVNDPGKRQVILLDSALANPKVVVDSAGGATMYGMSSGALIPFAGDSTLFVDRNASAISEPANCLDAQLRRLARTCNFKQLRASARIVTLGECSQDL